MSLRSFIDETASSSRQLAVFDGSVDGPLESMLAETFEEQPLDLTIDEAANSTPSIEADTKVVLIEDDRVVAESSLMELYDALLAINSDLFITGARELGEIELPDVLANLDNQEFRLRGYPLAHKEKFLLIVISRYIEQLAWETGRGTLRSSFQNLSRVTDEVGTHNVYKSMGETGVDVHLYGYESAESDIDDLQSGLEVSVHAGDSAEHHNAWFVVFRPDEWTEQKKGAALVCLEMEPRIWGGFWTYDRERVVAIDEYIAATL
ncbi:DICT sensory domain-containing protein [Natrialbaceae archaeon A-chndr2]